MTTGLRWYEWVTAVSICSAALVLVVCLNRIEQLRERPLVRTAWVPLKITYAMPGRYFLGVTLGPVYRSHRACLRSLPSSGYETLGHTTTFRQLECARVG